MHACAHMARMYPSPRCACERVCEPAAACCVAWMKLTGPCKRACAWSVVPDVRMAAMRHMNSLSLPVCRRLSSASSMRSGPSSVPAQLKDQPELRALGREPEAPVTAPTSVHTTMHAAGAQCDGIAWCRLRGVPAGCLWRRVRHALADQHTAVPRHACARDLAGSGSAGCVPASKHAHRALVLRRVATACMPRQRVSTRGLTTSISSSLRTWRAWASPGSYSYRSS